MKRVLFFLSLVVPFGCQKHDGPMPDAPPFSLDASTTEGMTVLGRRLENPYSVENMRRALRNLAPKTRAGMTDMDIQPTHYYVKFHPRSSEELDLLVQDSTVIWYDMPLDHEIEKYGCYYHDPAIPDSLPTYQYASIEVAKWPAVSTIGVDYEILSELFIPDEDKDEVEGDGIMTRSGAKWCEALTDALVEESLRMTGNEVLEGEEPLTRGRRKWRPAGRISYYDDVLGKMIGLEGVKVKARRWFTTHTGFVNAEGYYSCDGHFKRPANYSFALDRYEFQVNGDGVRVSYDGPKKTGNWDYHFARSKSQSEFFGATVFRAAYHYYYKDIGGLRRPPQNSFWRTKMRLKAINQQNNSSNGNFKSARRFLGLGSAIKLYNPQNTTDDLYATVIHELAHAAHWRMIVKEPGTNRYRDYHDAEEKMVESWATGVQWYLTKTIYPVYLGKIPFEVYTNVVMDMIDGSENDTNSRGISSQTNDKVSGYTISQIESALIGCDTWDKWKNNIKSKYSNATKQHLDELFAAWDLRNQ